MANHNWKQLHRSAVAGKTAISSIAVAISALTAKIAKNHIDSSKKQEKFNKLTSEIDSVNKEINDLRSEKMGLGKLFHKDKINELNKKSSKLSKERDGIYNKRK